MGVDNAGPTSLSIHQATFAEQSSVQHVTNTREKIQIQSQHTTFTHLNMQTNGLSPNLLSEPISQQPRPHYYMTCRSKALGLWPNLAQGATESTNPHAASSKCASKCLKHLPSLLKEWMIQLKIHNNETRRSKLSSSC